jgi:VanZ family protein
VARILFAVYVVLTAYASLYPLEGWRDFGLSPFTYLSAPWPRHVTSFDVVVNIAGYFPLGFLAVAALRPSIRGIPAFAIGTLLALVVTLALEALQSYIPARFPSNLDVLSNLAGAAAGAAAGARFAGPLFDAGPLQHWRARVFLPGPAVDVGLILIALWLFAQLNPTTLLFAGGDLRDLLAGGEGRARRPEFFIAIEAITAAANLAAVGLLFSLLEAPGVSARARIAALVVAAAAVKTAAFAVLMRAENVFAWLTPGAQIGLAAGLAVALTASAAPRIARLALAALLIMAATVLVNLAPANPYLAASLKVWQQGHFLNFNGLTRLVGSVWPFAALVYLVFVASVRR